MLMNTMTLAGVDPRYFVLGRQMREPAKRFQNTSPAHLGGVSGSTQRPGKRENRSLMRKETAADAARVVRPHLPIKRILQQVKDDLAEPQTGRP